MTPNPEQISVLVLDLMGSAKFTLLGRAEPRSDDDLLYDRFTHIVRLHLIDVPREEQT